MQSARFIPFRKQDIVDMCSEELNNSTQQTSFKQFCDLLASLIHYDYHATLEALKNNYAPFDPNSDTRSLAPVSADQKAQCQREFAKDFAKVLNAANFEVITNEDLQEALNEESLFKVRLEVEFGDFEKWYFIAVASRSSLKRLPVFGACVKSLLHFTNYDRVAVFIRFKDSAYFKAKNKTPLGFEPSSTIVKLFQNVPKADSEMLFPNSEVRMRPIDKVIIGSSALVGGAVVLITKLGASIVLLLALFAFWGGFRSEAVEMTQQHFITFAIGMGVFGSFIFKEWSKFKNRKIKFMKALSGNLYFKNLLITTRALFHTLIDAAEEEDIKEALLAYTFLLKSESGLSAQMLDEQIEHWFKSKYQCVLDFEISDALEKLVRMRLVTCSNEIEGNEKVYSALSLEHAKTILDERWDNLFQYN